MQHKAMKLALALCTLASVVSAQNNRDCFWPNANEAVNNGWGGVTVSTSVDGSTLNTLEIYQDRSSLLARGLGASSNTKCELSGMRYVVQDGDRTTSNAFSLVGRKATAPDGPADTTATGYLFTTAAFSTPTAAGTGAAAWAFTSTFAAPLPVLPCEAGYYLGVSLAPQLTATDRLTLQAATTYGATGVGDNPRIPCPKFHAARVDMPAALFTRSISQRTVTINGLFQHTTLNVGNIAGDPAKALYTSYGLGGAYPNCTGTPTPTDGLSFRVQDDSNVGGSGALFLATGYFPGGLNLGGIDGAVWIVPPITSLGSFTLPAAVPGTFIGTIVPPGTIPAVTGIQLTFQAVTVSATFTNGRLSNGHSVNL